MQLPYHFYQQHVLEAARNLLGKKLIFGKHEGFITEVEAYRGTDDAASHAARGMTPRSAIMFGPPGYVYVYRIYGLYYCLNIVTEAVGQASAVLIRGLGLPGLHLDGPGKICRYLGITQKEQGINLVTSHQFYVTEGVKVHHVVTTPRIGITKATDKLWRFCVDASEIKPIITMDRS